MNSLKLPLHFIRLQKQAHHSQLLLTCVITLRLEVRSDGDNYVHINTLHVQSEICSIFFRVKYREEQLQLRQEAKQQAKELALEQEQEKERRLDKLRQQVQCIMFIIFAQFMTM